MFQEVLYLVALLIVVGLVHKRIAHYRMSKRLRKIKQLIVLHYPDLVIREQVFHHIVMKSTRSIKELDSYIHTLKELIKENTLNA